MKSTGSPPPWTWRSSRRGRGVDAPPRHRRDTYRRTTQAIIFFFLWAEKSLRRARKQRRSESAEEPVDVESGERSPQ